MRHYFLVHEIGKLGIPYPYRITSAHNFISNAALSPVVEYTLTLTIFELSNTTVIIDLAGTSYETLNKFTPASQKVDLASKHFIGNNTN